MNTRICEALGLDPRLVLNHGKAYRGYARALLAEAGRSNEREGLDPSLQKPRAKEFVAARCAHYFSIAAGYMSAVEPDLAMECWLSAEDAANDVARMAAEKVQTESSEKIPEGVVTATSQNWTLRASLLACVCISSHRSFEELREIVRSAPASAPWIGQDLLLILARIVQANREAGWARELLGGVVERFERQHLVPAGVLRLPLEFPLRLAQQTLRSGGEDGDSVMFRWGQAFGERLGERIAIGQSTPGHWRQLYLRLLPIEPEGLLMTRLWLTLARRSIGARGFEELFRQYPVLFAYCEAARLGYGLNAQFEAGQEEGLHGEIS